MNFILKFFAKLIRLYIISIILFSCSSTDVTELPPPSPSSAPDALEFDELWGYVMFKHEDEWNSSLPLTDIGYFTEAVNTYSKIDPVPPKSKFFSETDARVHLVSSCDSKSQTHLLLDPKLPLRNEIINQLIKASETYDGLQIDWELVPPKDRDNFIDFLKTLKSKLGTKPLSIAIPARIKTLNSDAYNYELLAPVADKIIIMAYDQHWSTSAPGPIASTEWCKRISDYAKSKIPEDKLIMGMSFYGRTWRDDKDGGKAYIYPSMQKLIKENKIKKIPRDEELIPSFKYTKKLTIESWFDDAQSLKLRTQMYRDNGINKLSFWRIGQEDLNYWQYIKIKRPEVKINETQQ